MKVLCVTHEYVGPYSSFSVDSWFKIGEWYEVEDKGNYYTFFYDDRSFANLAKDYFKTVEQLRHEILHNLGI